MIIIKNDLEVEVDEWDDPGDYPSNAGSGPLPGYKYIGAVNGEVVLELTDEELVDLPEFIDNLEIDFPSELKTCKFKQESLVGHTLVLIVSEFEAEVVEEGDYDDDCL
jgi:hypothetical protein